MSRARVETQYRTEDGVQRAVYIVDIPGGAFREFQTWGELAAYVATLDPEQASTSEPDPS
jgi:hypothetical protein